MAEQTTQPVAGVEEWLSPEYRSLPENTQRLREIRAKLDREGVVELLDFITPEAHELLKRQVLELESEAQQTAARGNRKATVKGDQLTNTVVGELARSRYTLELVNGVLGSFEDANAWTDEPIRAGEVIPGINLIRGPGDATAYHFDGTYLNLILPIIIPKIDGPRRGQLVIYPNIRSFRRTFFDRKLVPAISRVRQLRRIWKKVEVDYRERGVYLFYGYRSLHGVDSPSEASLRCITNMTVGSARFN